MGKSLRKSDTDASRRYYEEARALYRELGDTWNETMTLSWLNDVVGRADGLDAAEQVVSECLALRESIGDRRGASFSLVYLGSIALRQGRPDDARRRLQRALTYHRELDDRHGIEVALHALSNVHVSTGRFVEAQRSLQKSLHIARQTGQYVIQKDNLLSLGRAALMQQNVGEAKRYFQRALTLSRDLGYQPTVADALGYLGVTSLYVGRLSQAQNLLDESVTLCETISYDHGLTQWLATLGLVAVHAGDLERAGTLSKRVTDEPAGARLMLALLALDHSLDADLDACVELVRGQQNRRLQHDLLEAQALAGVAAARLNRPEQAWKYLCDATRRSIDVRAFVPLLYALAGMTLLLPERGDRKQAVMTAAMMAQHPFVAESTWFDEILKACTTALADQMPAHDVAVAQAAGRTADMWEMAGAIVPCHL